MRSNVFRTIVHQEFDDDSASNDIALLMLETQLKISNRILPICFPKLDIAFEIVGKVVGFGGAKSSNLKDVEVSIVDENECVEADVNVSYDSICAGKKGAKEVVCTGDSGKFSLVKC